MQALLPSLVDCSRVLDVSTLHILVVDVRGADLAPAALARGGLQVQVKYGERGRSALCDLGDVAGAAAPAERKAQASGGTSGLAHVAIGSVCMFMWYGSAEQILRFRLASRHGVSHVAKAELKMDAGVSELRCERQLDLRRRFPALPCGPVGRLHVAIRRHKVRLGDLLGMLADLNAQAQPGGSFLLEASKQLAEGSLSQEELAEHDDGVPLLIGKAVR